MTPSSQHSAPGKRGDLFDPECPTRRLLDRIGTKSDLHGHQVLAEAAPKEVRFAELQRRMTGVSQKMLSVTLQNMTRDGLVHRRVEAAVPPRVHCGSPAGPDPGRTAGRAPRMGRGAHEPRSARANERHAQETTA